MADADLGSDFSAVTDVDPNLRRVKGRFALAQAIARRLTTPSGLKFYDLNYGFDVRAFVNAPAQQFRVERGVEIEALKDERVLAADATVTFITEDDPPRLTIGLTLTDDDGPFDLTLNVDELSVELLREFT